MPNQPDALLHTFIKMSGDLVTDSDLGGPEPALFKVFVGFDMLCRPHELEPWM